MGGRPRCVECRRIIIPEGEPATNLPSLEGMEETLPRLVDWAREFDHANADGDSYTAIDFLDWLALSLHAEGKYTKPAGNPAQMGTKRKAA
jgi:hypothetical protein